MHNNSILCTAIGALALESDPTAIQRVDKGCVVENLCANVSVRFATCITSRGTPGGHVLTVL